MVGGGEFLILVMNESETLPAGGAESARGGIERIGWSVPIPAMGSHLPDNFCDSGKAATCL